MLAVPTRVSPEDFVRFCGPHLECAADIRFIRDDGVEDRYSVLVEFEDQSSAEWFYADLNGWRFSTSESEVCHVLFIAAVQYTPSSEVATTPPAGSTELPMCPVCIGELTVLYFFFVFWGLCNTIYSHMYVSPWCHI